MKRPSQSQRSKLVGATCSSQSRARCGCLSEVLTSRPLRSNAVTNTHETAAPRSAFCHIRRDANAVSGGPVFLHDPVRGSVEVRRPTPMLHEENGSGEAARQTPHRDEGTQRGGGMRPRLCIYHISSDLPWQSRRIHFFKIPHRP